ncbi:MAG: hypothetical protein ACR2L6_05570 [Gemmatimonadaceae bacterium]
MKTLTLIAALLALAGPASAQSTPAELTARLREVLPAEIAEGVIATVSDARSRGLPARALEQRALMLARKGAEPGSIARSVADQSRAMGEAKAALARGRTGRPADGDVAAGAEAIRKGVDGAQVSELAKSAPSGRSLALPLFVIGNLVDRGLPSDAALARVLERMNARATDAELARLPEQAMAGRTRGEAARAGRPDTKPALPAAGGRGAAGGTVRGSPPPNVPPRTGGRGRPAGTGRP